MIKPTAASLTKKELPHGNKNEDVEEVMKQKGIKLRELIIQPFSYDNDKKL